MSEEEKEAIREAKSEIEVEKSVNCMFAKWLDIEKLQTLLNLIDKLQKENKELKEDNSHQWEERCRLTFELDKLQKENETNRMSEEEKLEILKDKFLKYHLEYKDEEMLFEIIDKLEKEVKEYNKRGQTLRNLANQKGSKMYELICKDFIPKEKIRNKIKELEELYDENEKETTIQYQNQWIVDVVGVLEELLGDDNDEN